MSKFKGRLIENSILMDELNIYIHISLGGILATSFQQSVPLTEAYANATQLPYINLRELSLYND